MQRNRKIMIDRSQSQLKLNLKSLSFDRISFRRILLSMQVTKQKEKKKQKPQYTFLQLIKLCALKFQLASIPCMP